VLLKIRGNAEAFDSIATALPQILGCTHSNLIHLSIQQCPLQLIRILLSELLTPFPNRFVSDFNAMIEHHLLNVPVAQGKSLIQLDAVADNFARKSMTRVYGQAGKLNAEPVRLFYIRVKLTMPSQVKPNPNQLFE
jgi:hypothetical protein